MTHSILQKVTFTTLALVASLALSARAGTATLSSAKQTHGSGKSIKPLHQLLFPASTYMVDDGASEDAVGLTFGGDVIALNEFAVIPGSETITTVSIAWGTPVFPDPSLNGLSYTVAVWSDPNGDGNPSDAVLLTTANGVVALQGTNTFLTTDIPDTTITTPNFFVGFLIANTVAGQFPAAFDETNPTFSKRSYVAGGSAGTGDINNLNNNELPVTAIESFGLVGNWLIRADATGGGGGGDLVLESAVSRKTHGRQGDFDIDLPLSGSTGIECRTGLQKNTIMFTFNNSIASVGSATTSCDSSLGSSTISGNQVTVKFNGTTCNQSTVAVTLSDVMDTDGNTLASAAVNVGILTGDVSGDGRVKNGDIANVQAVQGQQTNSSNFRDDVTLDGRINTQDVQTVKSHRNEVLP